MSKKVIGGLSIITILIVICLLFLASCKSSNKMIVVSKADISAEIPVVQHKEKIMVGEVTELNNVQLQVIEVKKTRGDDFNEPKKGYEYIIVTFAIKNTGTSEISYSLNYSKIVNSKGEISEMASSTYSSDIFITSGELLPGGLAIGSIAYEQLIDDPELKFIFKPNLLNDEEFTVDLMRSLDSFGVIQDDFTQIDDIKYGMNEYATIDKAQIRITEVKKLKGNKHDVPEEEHEFVSVNVEIKNIGSEILNLNSCNYKMCNTKVRITSCALYFFEDDTSLEQVDLEPGGEIKGTVSFQQPIDDPALKFIFEEDFLGKNKLIFNLDY